jgi:type I restriction enzyme R subunit
VLAKVTKEMLKEAVAPLVGNPQLRERLADAKRSLEQTIDQVSRDEVLDARYAPEIKESVAKKLVTSFEAFIQQHKDEIEALQVMYSVPYARRLTHDDVKALADAIKAPPRQWTPDVLWRAYETLEHDKVKGAGSARLLTDVVSLVRFALDQEKELVPFAEGVRARFAEWMAQQESQGRTFTDEQRAWLEAIREHVAANAEVAVDDLEYVPFNQLGGLGKAYRVFGADLTKVIDELNQVLAA